MDGFGGFNISVIVVEVPMVLVQGKGHRTRTYLGNDTTIGVWGTTSRSKIRRLSTHHEPREFGPYIQGQRMGHQVFKTIFLPGRGRRTSSTARSQPTTPATSASTSRTR